MMSSKLLPLIIFFLQSVISYLIAEKWLAFGLTIFTSPTKNVLSAYPGIETFQCVCSNNGRVYSTAYVASQIACSHFLEETILS